ncbi:MAG: hypothetical protein C4320_01520 [Armatimonadota bacterium]
MVYFAGGGVALAALGALLVKYQDEGIFLALGQLMIVGAVVLGAIAIKLGLQVRKVSAYSVECPFCTNNFDVAEELKSEDVSCTACNRMVPIQDGRVLSVNQVRCGFCNALNYFSEKTDALLCESCNHEIPIFHEEGHVAKKKIAAAYAVVDDDATYELIFKGGKPTEELISCLQHMLALNRNQVKELMEEAPVTLLTGITRMKATMLKAQLETHGGDAEARVLESSQI